MKLYYYAIHNYCAFVKFNWVFIPFIFRDATDISTVSLARHYYLTVSVVAKRTTINQIESSQPHICHPFRPKKTAPSQGDNSHALEYVETEEWNFTCYKGGRKKSIKISDCLPQRARAAPGVSFAHPPVKRTLVD